HMSDETLDMYLGRSVTDSLFYASEAVLNISLLGAADIPSRKEKLNDLIGAIVSQAGNWLLLIQGIIDVFLRRYPAVQEREPASCIMKGLGSTGSPMRPAFGRHGGAAGRSHRW
ncbi:MAG TPA: hypothetical protein VHJ99_17255, partial [Candidatus Dormibacteraeota bacterium]|nr:hypothetical protein [Candidatus Dormibacteraeota bacterium]